MREDNGPPLPEAPQPRQEPESPTMLYRFVSAAAGFGWAGLFAVVVTVIGLILSGGEYLPILESGPVAGVILWGIGRKFNADFARGGIVFGIVSFLLVGTCFVNLTSIVKWIVS